MKTRRLTESEYKKFIKLAQQKSGYNAELHHDTISECVILNKETGQCVEKFSARFDEAEKLCKQKIWGRPYLGYEIMEVVCERVHNTVHNIPIDE